MIARSLSGALVALTLLSGALAAQTVPFGKNKIQYRSFDWHILSGDQVDVYYYPEAETLARMTLAYAEESFEFLSRRFQHHPERRIPLIVYASDQHFEQTNVYPGFIPEGVLGFTEYMKRRVALPFRGDYDQFRKTLRHELVHAFQLSKLEETQRLHPRVRRATPQRVPWWTEGLAEFWSGEQTTEDDMFVRDLVVHGRLPSIPEFTYVYSYAAYALGGELHSYLAERFGEEYIARMYEEYWKYDSFEDALAGVLGVRLDQLSREWRYALEQRFFPGYAERPPLDVAATPIITRGANFKPALYLPPGDTIPELLFLSPRTGYTNLYRTRLDRGESGIEVLLEGQRSAEFESFHPTESRFDVSSNGVVAIVSKYMERDGLYLWDLDRRRVVGRYQWSDLVGLSSPSWDPTGTRVVFEGLSTDGYSNLYVVDFERQERIALTSDHFLDEDPAWSPDGRLIAFASDRTPYGREGSRNLFILDVASGELRYLTHGPWRDRSPRWSNDGERIAFTSDRDGHYDLYAIGLDGRGSRLTEFSGALFDPVWLPGDEGIVFAGFMEGSMRIYRADLPRDSAGEAALALGVDAEAAEDLPIGWEWEELESATLATADVKRYESWRSVSVDFAGGDAVVAPGVGASQGAQFLASDVLGDHIIYAGISATQSSDFQSFLDRFSGNLLYLNLARRLNYGAGVYRFTGLFRDVAMNIYEERTYGGYFVASYPFSRFNRVELQLGVEHSDRLDWGEAFDFTLIGRTTRPDPRDLTREGILTTNYLSYVKDNTLWLPTGPIDGERYNITVGLVTCFSCTSPSSVTSEPVTRGAAPEHYVLTADYRRYFRTTLRSAYAVRGYGFFSDGAIPARAVLGGSHRLRGYPRYSLAGSRVWLVNQEWRFPILHGVAVAFPFGEIRLPGVQGGLFVDMGSSWLEGESPEGTWGSYGIGLRTSLGYPLVLRWDIGRRFRIGEHPPILFGSGKSFGSSFVDFFFGYNF